MKKLPTAIAAALFVIYSSICFASYVIHLKDGRKFATDRYSEEGDQIKFKRYGGVIGIQKDRIREIEVVETVEEPPVGKEAAAKPEKPTVGAETSKREKTEAEAAKAEAPKQGGAEEAEEAKEKAKEEEKPEEVSEEEKKTSEQEKAAKIEAFLEEKRLLNHEIRRVYSDFKEAKSKKNIEKRRELFSKLKSLRNKLSELEQKVRAAYGGKLPEWWKDAG